MVKRNQSFLYNLPNTRYNLSASENFHLIKFKLHFAC